MLSIFSCGSGISVCPPWRSVSSGPLTIICLPGVESCAFFIHFGDQTFVRGIICKYVFPYDWFSFHFTAVFFNCAEAFYLMSSHLLILSFMSLALGDISVKILLLGISEIFLPVFSSRTFMVL